MSTTRSVSPGKSRRCPHCRSEILESASVCPICRHHLKFGKAAELPGRRFSALHVEGTVRHPADESPWEYSVVISVKNQKGDEVARHVVGIGSMSGNDLRTFDLSVDVFAPDARAQPPEAPSAEPATTSAAIKSSTVSAARVVASAPRAPASPLTRLPGLPNAPVGRPVPAKGTTPTPPRASTPARSSERPPPGPDKPPPKKPTDR